MDRMFRNASVNFNGDIGGWAVHSVTQMGRMFEGASAFQDLGWCVDDERQPVVRVRQRHPVRVDVVRCR